MLCVVQVLLRQQLHLCYLQTSLLLHWMARVLLAVLVQPPHTAQSAAASAVFAAAGVHQPWQQ
jgi:hypothetical protein